MERGKLGVLNPMRIPAYEGQDGFAVRRPLTGSTRTPLRTWYLHQYLSKEPLGIYVTYLLTAQRSAKRHSPSMDRPTTRPLDQHYPNANNPQLAIEYSIPVRGCALVEIFDDSGNNLEVISKAICDAQYHVAAWITDILPANTSTVCATTNSMRYVISP